MVIFLLISVLRTIILYILVVIALRIMGKRQIGELQPSELVVAIMISDLATVPMSDNAIPLLYGIAPIFTLVLCELLVSFFCLKSQWVRLGVTGRPTYIINNGVIDQSEMKKARYSLSDLLEELRMLNIFDVSSVNCAILETNGKISVVTKKDVSEKAYVLVCDGNIQNRILDMSPYTKKDIKKFIGNHKIKDVFLLSIDINKKVYLALKE